MDPESTPLDLGPWEIGPISEAIDSRDRGRTIHRVGPVWHSARGEIAAQNVRYRPRGDTSEAAGRANTDGRSPPQEHHIGEPCGAKRPIRGGLDALGREREAQGTRIAAFRPRGAGCRPFGSMRIIVV